MIVLWRVLIAVAVLGFTLALAVVYVGGQGDDDDYIQ